MQEIVTHPIFYGSLIAIIIILMMQLNSTTKDNDRLYQEVKDLEKITKNLNYIPKYLMDSIGSQAAMLYKIEKDLRYARLPINYVSGQCGKCGTYERFKIQNDELGTITYTNKF